MADIAQPEAARIDAKPAIGGGFIVMRRGNSSRRLRGVQRPFEHASLEKAEAEAAYLAQQYRREFYVFQQVAIARAPAAPASSTDEAA